MFESFIEEAGVSGDSFNNLGSFRIEDVDNPEKNALHLEAMDEEEKNRYGECFKMAKKIAEEQGADVYTTNNNQHSIAIKNDKVYDYVLGYNFDISVNEYMNKVPFSFIKNEEN